MVQAFRSPGLRAKRRDPQCRWIPVRDDFQRLRGDAGLADFIGHDLPAPSAALQFLYAFHEEEKIAEANQQRWPEQMA